MSIAGIKISTRRLFQFLRDMWNLLIKRACRSLKKLLTFPSSFYETEYDSELLLSYPLLWSSKSPPAFNT